MTASIPDTMPEIVTRQPPTASQRIWCWFGFHDWVGRTDLGGEPDRAKVNGPDLIKYFYEFAAPVCKHCPRQLPPLRR